MERKTARFLDVNRPCFIIPRPIQLEEIPEVPRGFFRRQHSEIGQRQILLFLGRLHAKKRLDLIAGAFIRIANRRHDVHLVIAGPEGGASPQAKEVLKQAGLMDRVTFTGFLSGVDKWAAFQDSSLFLLPSEDENFGVAVLEAMAVGVPVLLSAYVGIAEWVTRARAGIVIDQTPIAWADAIEQLLKNPQALRAMGEASRRLVRQEFSSMRIATQMRDTYAEILQQHPRP
jgi:glycosyltransferase involved in cell wall biosynthesis